MFWILLTSIVWTKTVESFFIRVLQKNGLRVEKMMMTFFFFVNYPFKRCNSMENVVSLVV